MAPQQKLDWARVALSEPVLTEDAEHALLTLEQDDVVGTNARAVLLRWYEEHAGEKAVEVLERWIASEPGDRDELLVKRSSYLRNI